MPPAANSAMTSKVAKELVRLGVLPAICCISCIAGSFRGFRVATLSRKRSTFRAIRSDNLGELDRAGKAH